MNLNCNFIQKNSSIYGPGDRYVIWTQGCSLHCDGCWNQDTWSFKPNLVLSEKQIIEDIQEQGDSIEGVTILGGEPLDQYGSVFSLVQSVKKLNLSIMLYTGYDLEEIYNLGFSDILNFVDIIIPGRFDVNKRNTNLQWRGSENQKIQYNSARYINYQNIEGNYIEINIDENGVKTILGYPEKNFLNRLMNQ